MSEVAQTTKEVIEVVTTALQPLAEKLGTTAQYVWGLQVKQAYVDGFVALASFMFGVMMIIGSIGILFKIFNNGEKASEAEAWLTGGSLISIIVGFTICASWFSTILNCFINPEYYALQQLIKLVK
jgi:hypothetical protein